MELFSTPLSDLLPVNQQIPEIEISYKSKVKASARPRVTDAKSAYDLLMKNWDSNAIELYEEFKVLLLNKGNRAIGILNLSKGGTAGTVVDVKLLFASVLKCNAGNIIIAHNHPSYNLSPSKADDAITKTIKEAAKLFDIVLCDHLIVTPDGYFSFANEGLL